MGHRFTGPHRAGMAMALVGVMAVMMVVTAITAAVMTTVGIVDQRPGSPMTAVAASLDERVGKAGVAVERGVGQCV